MSKNGIKISHERKHKMKQTKGRKKENLRKTERKNE